MQFGCLAFALFPIWACGFTNDIGVTLEWDPNPDAEVVQYHAYVGTQSGSYDRFIDAGTQTSVHMSPLDPGVTYYFSVTTSTLDGLESPFSSEISYTVPIDGTNADLTPLAIMLPNIGSSVSLAFNVNPGLQYMVQASFDLRTWQTLETLAPETADTITWNDISAPSYPQRFYRIVALK